ncbi:MAG TPA: HPr(Ser) kinase/phosphatase [Deltaproteobacteria bacterium]|nr:HPr(Ser) kinase/phosphatase [Deltaproteobacteria bacterium]
MGIPIKELLADSVAARLALRVVAGAEGLGREIETSRIQKPGLLLTGLLEELHSDRVQILGAAEIGYLTSLDAADLERALGTLERARIPAVIVTRGIEPPAFLVELGDRNGIPVLASSHTSSVLIDRLTKFLEERLAPVTTLHGVFMDVLGVGILVLGKSGIGKSECALDLISRGHRLVADDVVVIKRMPPSVLFGTAVDLSRYHMEVRGLGIVNIKDLFGITAIRERKQMDIVVELVRWDPAGEYERIGLEEMSYEILGVELPYFVVPVSPGRSIATIVEVAARNQILKIMGYNSAREFARRLNKRLVRSGR